MCVCVCVCACVCVRVCVRVCAVTFHQSSSTSSVKFTRCLTSDGEEERQAEAEEEERN